MAHRLHNLSANCFGHGRIRCLHCATQASKSESAWFGNCARKVELQAFRSEHTAREGTDEKSSEQISSRNF